MNMQRPGGGGVLCKFLGGDVPLGHWNPYPILDHVQLDLVTLFYTRHQKTLPYSRLRYFPENLSLP